MKYSKIHEVGMADKIEFEFPSRKKKYSNIKNPMALDALIKKL